MPSSSSSRRVHTIASRLVTKIFRSSRRDVDDRRDEAVVERAQALHGLALHRLGGDDLDASPSSSLKRRPLPISVPPVPRPATKAAIVVELLEDLGRRAVVVGGRVGLVAVLVGHVVARVGRGHVERHRDRAVGALVARRVDDLRAVHLQQLGALGRDVLGHHDLERIALARADHRQRDAGVAGGRLEDRLARADRALLLGVLDQRARDAVLDRARRVVRLELGPDAHAGLGRQALELDERRVADRLHDVPVAAPAGAVLQLMTSHFRKCSHSARYGKGGCG